MLTSAAPSDVGVPDSIPYSLPIEITLTDPEIIAEVWPKTEGRERDEYVVGALRVGILALRQARGHVDAAAIRHEGEHLLKEVQTALLQHRTHLDNSLSGTLREYFDPSDGRFTERVQSLLKKDGELESLLARKITAQDSEMSKTLAMHVGKESSLFRLLSPTESEGLLAALRTSVNEELASQRTQVLNEFSLDNKEGALARLVLQLTDSNGQLTKNLQGKIDGMLQQFSFDDEKSALSRMKQTIDTTKEAISKHLTLDDENSALFRLRRELLELLEKHTTASQTLQEKVLGALEAMKARREEAAVSTRHGVDFESQVFEVVQTEAQRLRDVATSVGNSTGEVRNCKKGDAVVELGPESPAPGARIVVEAKEDASYDLRAALSEIEEARLNRKADVGLFVFSRKTAPKGLEPLARYGDHVVVIWDSEDNQTDLYLTLGVSVARAICTRKATERSTLTVDFTSIDAALLEISKQVEALDEIRTWSDTIARNSEKITERVRISREKIRKQGDHLSEMVDGLKGVLAKSGTK